MKNRYMQKHCEISSFPYTTKATRFSASPRAPAIRGLHFSLAPVMWKISSNSCLRGTGTWLLMSEAVPCPPPAWCGQLCSPACMVKLIKRRAVHFLKASQRDEEINGAGKTSVNSTICYCSCTTSELWTANGVFAPSPAASQGEHTILEVWPEKSRYRLSTAKNSL